MLDIISRSFVISLKNPDEDARLNLKINEHQLMEFLSLRTAVCADIKKATGQLKFPHSVKIAYDSIDSNNPLKWELNDGEVTLKPFNGHFDCTWTTNANELMNMAYCEVFPMFVKKGTGVVSTRMGQLQKISSRHLNGIYVNEEVWYGDERYINVSDGDKFAIRFKSDGKKWNQCSSYMTDQFIEDVRALVKIEIRNQGYSKVQLADYIRPLIEQYPSIQALKKHLQSN